MAFNVENILTQLDAETSSWKQAKALISESDNPTTGKLGRPRKVVAATPPKKTHGLTPEGRARIADAVRRRWANQKKGK